jgi:catechol 2,3-dioxygenase-like lactoylglutathione lyase family enzyme
MQEPQDSIQDIAGVVFWTDNLEEMVRFYQGVLGLKLHSHHGDFVAFELRPGVRLNLGRHSQVRGRAKDPHRVMLHLKVGDIVAVYNRLKDRGTVFLREPAQETWGGWVATFQDPDGNILQLLQLPA